MDDVLIEVDEETCIGSGTCEVLAPDAIEVGDDAVAHAKGVRIPLELASQICERCPSGAIRIVEG